MQLNISIRNLIKGQVEKKPQVLQLYSQLNQKMPRAHQQFHDHDSS